MPIKHKMNVKQIGATKYNVIYFLTLCYDYWSHSAVIPPTGPIACGILELCTNKAFYFFVWKMQLMMSLTPFFRQWLVMQ